MSLHVILLDTNVVSEVMRLEPSQEVLDWFSRQDSERLYFSAVSEAELRKGAAILPVGRRRDQLIAGIDAMMDEDFAGQILPFDSFATRSYAEIAAERRRIGRPILEADCQIAAIARAWSMALATRNARDFEGCGLKMINPWHPETPDTE